MRWQLCDHSRSGTDDRIYWKSSFYRRWYRISQKPSYLWRRFSGIFKIFQIYRRYLCNSGRNCRISSRTTRQSNRSDHGGTACRNRNPEYHQSSESDCYQSSQSLLCSPWGRNHGIRPASCTGAGCRYLWCSCSCHRWMRRNFQRTDRTDV